jgi:hypothetical protein
MSIDSNVTLSNEKNVRLPEHEFLLQFGSDEGAEYFEYWWIERGHKDFVEYCENQEGTTI